MAIKGITKLPIAISKSEYISLMNKLPFIAEKIAVLNEKYKMSVISDGLINLLSLKESVESTRIEGTQVTFTEVVNKTHEDKDWKLREVANYQEALAYGYEQIKNGYPLTTRLILDLHRVLMDKGRGTQGGAGEFRKIQNHIGPSSDIREAVYIPISAEEINEYMSNWEDFTNCPQYGEAMDVSHIKQKDDSYIIDENSHPLLKVAIMHAQFESIHPFLDGNGRMGRILIALYMAQTKITSSPFFFVSEELERSKYKYYHFLNNVRGDNPKWFDWIDYFLNATDKMADKLIEVLNKVEQIVKRGLAKCDNETQRKVFFITTHKINVTSSDIAKKLKIHQSTARKALNALCEKNVLYKNTEKKRNIEYFNYDILELLDDE